ncbi:MAG: hypothetical protein M3Y49_16710, partial [Actinomycetota bacterium]|nr:hypothetical protein [Actinomycetota bacterium]
MSEVDPSSAFPSKDEKKKRDGGAGSCGPECADCGDCGDCNPFLIAGMWSLLWATARGFGQAPATTKDYSPIRRVAVRAVRSYQVNVAARRARP